MATHQQNMDITTLKALRIYPTPRAIPSIQNITSQTKLSALLKNRILQNHEQQNQVKNPHMQQNRFQQNRTTQKTVSQYTLI